MPTITVVLLRVLLHTNVSASHRGRSAGGEQAGEAVLHVALVLLDQPRLRLVDGQQQLLQVQRRPRVQPRAALHGAATEVADFLIHDLSTPWLSSSIAAICVHQRFED